MANFVEQATLQIVDKSSGPTRKINSELRSLLATAKKLKNIPINFKGVARTSSQVRKLTADVERLRAVARGRAPVIKLPTVPAAQIRGIEQLTQALRRYSAAVRSVPQISFPRAPGGGGGVPPVRPPVSPRVPGGVNINTGPLQTLLSGFIGRLGYTIESSIVRGFQRGTTDIDIAETRLGLLQVPPEQRNLARDIASATAREFQVISRGQALGLVSELIPVVRPTGATEEDAAGLSSVTTELAKFVELRVALGDSADVAVATAIDLAKAGEQMGRFTDAAGNINPAGVTDFFRTIQQGFAQMGQEGTAQLLRGLAKSLRTSKLTLDNEGLLAALFLAEESGTTAGVGINQAIKTLTGERTTKKVLNNLEALGLLSTRQVTAGAVGNQSITELVGDGAVNDAELRQNILRWVVDNVIPKIREQGLNPNAPTDVARFAGQISSDRTATDAIVQLILRSDELLQNIARAQAIEPERFRDTLDTSLLVAAQEAQSQLTAILGEVGNSFKTILIPALTGVASVANTVSSFLSGPTGEGSLARTATVAAGAVGAGALAYTGGKGVLSFLNPLNGSATRLTGAADALMRAAIALQRGSAAGAVAPGPSKGRRPPGAVPSVAGGSAGLGFAGWLGLFSTAAGEFERATTLANLNEQERAKFIEQERASIQERSEGWNKSIESFMDNVLGKGLTDLLVTRQTEIDAAAPTAAPPGADLIAKNEETARLTSEIAALTAKITQARDMEKIPGTADAQVTQLEAQRDFLNQQLTALGTSNTALATTFTTGSTQLQTNATLFDQAFATGGAELNAGAENIRSAINILDPVLRVAFGAGAEQVSAAIRNALSSPVSVNVSASSPQAADTGAALPH